MDPSLIGPRRIVIISVLAGALAALIAMFWPAKYEASVVLLLSGPAQTDGLSPSYQLPTIAQFLSGTGGLSTTGDTYIGVMKTRAVLERVLTGVDTTTHQGPLLPLFLGKNGDSARERQAALSMLRQSVRADYDASSGLLTVTARHTNPVVAAAICNLIVAELRRFDAQVRFTQARAAVDFVMGRLEDAKKNLLDAEDELVAFQSANARIGNAPGLLIRQRRLERNVKITEDLYVLLAGQLESARIREKRELPVFSVADPPVIPASRSGPSPIKVGLAAVILSACLLSVLRIGLVYTSGR